VTIPPGTTTEWMTHPETRRSGIPARRPTPPLRGRRGPMECGGLPPLSSPSTAGASSRTPWWPSRRSGEKLVNPVSLHPRQLKAASPGGASVEVPHGAHTPKRPATSRSHLRLAAKKRPNNRPCLSFSIRACQLAALLRLFISGTSWLSRGGPWRVESTTVRHPNHRRRENDDPFPQPPPASCPDRRRRSGGPRDGLGSGRSRLADHDRGEPAQVGRTRQLVQ
jgi:hypothetical protein